MLLLRLLLLLLLLVSWVISVRWLSVGRGVVRVDGVVDGGDGSEGGVEVARG